MHPWRDLVRLPVRSEGRRPSEATDRLTIEDSAVTGRATFHYIEKATITATNTVSAAVGRQGRVQPVAFVATHGRV